MSLDRNVPVLLKPTSLSADRKSRSSPSSPAMKRKKKNKLFSSFRTKGESERSTSPSHTFVKCVKEKLGVPKCISPSSKHRRKSTPTPPREKIKSDRTLRGDTAIMQTSTFPSSRQPKILVSQTHEQEEEEEMPISAVIPATKSLLHSLLSTEKMIRKDTSRLSMESGYNTDGSRSDLLNGSCSDILQETAEKADNPRVHDDRTACAQSENESFSFSEAQRCENRHRDIHPTRRFTTSIPHEVSTDSPSTPKASAQQPTLDAPRPGESNASCTSLSSSLISPPCSRRGSLASLSLSRRGSFASPSCGQRGSLVHSPSVSSQLSILSTTKYYRVTPKKYLKRSQAMSALHLSELMSDDEDSVSGTLRKLRISIHLRRSPELPAKPILSTAVKDETRGNTNGCGCSAKGLCCSKPTIPSVRHPSSCWQSDAVPSELAAMRDWLQEEVRMLEYKMAEKIERATAKMERECGRLSEHVCDLEGKTPRAYSDTTSASSIQVCGSMDSLCINVTMPRHERSQSVSMAPCQRRASASPSYQSLHSLREESVMSPNELPCQQVDNAVIRNLSQELASWKFPARALGLQEAEIDLIRLDNQCDTREQCYKMLQLWVQRYWQNATYQTLGRALQSEARDVYPKYVDIVSSFLS